MLVMVKFMTSNNTLSPARATVARYPAGISEADFDAILAAHRHVLVDVYTEWCGPCKLVAPVLDQVAHRYTNVHVVSVNLERCADEWIGEKWFHMRVIPTFLYFNDGELVHHDTGNKNELLFEIAIKEAFDIPPPGGSVRDRT